MAEELNTVDAFAQISFLVQSMVERRAGEHGLSLIQTRLLGILRDRKPTISELAQLLDLDKSSTSGLVDRAQRRGLVKRLQSQIDRRSVRVSLTTEGRTLVERVSRDFSGDIAAIVAPLGGDDSATLTALLSRVLVAYAASQGVELFG